MPWDEIKPLEIVKVIDVSPFITEIESRSKERLQKSEQFQRLAEDIERYGERKMQETISLNRVKRLAFREEDEYWASRSKSIFGNRDKNDIKDSDQDDEEKDNKEKEQDQDLYLEESLHILCRFD